MTRDKIRVAVLMGGPSSEYEVSLHTGDMVLKTLNRRKYLSKAIKIARDGKWPVTLSKLKSDFDIVFNAMHGEYGEDGTVQRILESYKIPYTGSRAKASALGMNKGKAASIFKKSKISVPPYVIGRSPAISTSWFRKFGRPLVIKPADRGSSVGVNFASSSRELEKAIKKALQISKKFIVQKYVSGRELTCGVIEIKGKLKALPSTEIIPAKAKFFDYYSKYTKGASREITPAKIPYDLRKKIREISVRTHRAIGAAGYSRTDFILDKGGKLWVLEINTLPGLTYTSLLPKGARAAGISFKKLLELIIESALRKSYT